ncbi:MAG: tetratricopeptide repeat protein [Saprospiraceae bacterium]|nr:tetratricopeptide repeat protein [Saprospiraceae bacterium]
MKNQIVTCILLFLLGVGAFEIEAQSSHQALRKGDRKYDREKYQEAEQNYRIAADAEFGNPQAVYNLGNALYQQGKWEDAAQRFGQAARDFQTPADRSNAWHNLGNAQMKMNKFKAAVQAYENSLRLRPGNNGTKMNLQMAKKKVKEEEEREKQKEQQQQQQNQEPPPEQNPNEQNQPNQPPPRPKEDQKNQQSPSQPDQSGNPQEQQQTKMSKEDAKRLLESAVDPEDQRNARKYRSAQPSRNKRSKKDW